MSVFTCLASETICRALFNVILLCCLIASVNCCHFSNDQLRSTAFASCCIREPNLDDMAQQNVQSINQSWLKRQRAKPQRNLKFSKWRQSHRHNSNRPFNHRAKPCHNIFRQRPPRCNSLRGCSWTPMMREGAQVPGETNSCFCTD